MQAAYVARRFGVFLLIVWLAASLNFFLPRLSGQDPVRTKLLQQAALGGYVQGGIDEMTKEYERRFGLDKPLWRQYLSYLDGVAHLDFNYSIANYPRRVSHLIADALPWAVALLVATGGWALGMRGMMVTTMGEDYVTFAEAKGLKAPTVFLRYCLRNAILPQVTALALALGQILSGAVLVEVIFGYPGIGTLLFQAIRENDHFVIQGVVFTVIVALGFTTFVLDVIYPWLDPRISYRRA